MRLIQVIYCLVGLGQLLIWFPYSPMYYEVPWRVSAIKWGAFLSSIAYLSVGGFLGAVLWKKGLPLTGVSVGIAAAVFGLIVMADWLIRISAGVTPSIMLILAIASLGVLAGFIIGLVVGERKTR